MKKNFCVHLQYNDDLKEIQYGGDLENLIEVFILCKYSFENQNINISNLIQNPSSVRIPGKVKLNFSANEIMKFKNDKIDFYILDTERLNNIFAKKGKTIKINSNILLADKITYKILYFSNEMKYISFTFNKNPNSRSTIINLKNNLTTKNNIYLGKNNSNNDFNSNNNFNQKNSNYIQQNNENNYIQMELND